MKGMEQREITPADPVDAAALSAISFAAKAHWGYPIGWLEIWRAQLTLTPEFIAAHETWKILADGQLAGFYTLENEDVAWQLEHLWVQPEKMGAGLGRALFEHACAQAARRGATCLTIISDPHAEAFYRHLGAELVGTVQSNIGGVDRKLPLLRRRLA